MNRNLDSVRPSESSPPPSNGPGSGGNSPQSVRRRRFANTTGLYPGLYSFLYFTFIYDRIRHTTALSSSPLHSSYKRPYRPRITWQIRSGRISPQSWRLVFHHPRYFIYVQHQHHCHHSHHSFTSSKSRGTFISDGCHNCRITHNPSLLHLAVTMLVHPPYATWSSMLIPW